MHALERHSRGECAVIPIILRPVDWSHAPFANLQALPRDGKPVTTWNNREQAFANIAEGIRNAAMARQQTAKTNKPTFPPGFNRNPEPKQ